MVLCPSSVGAESDPPPLEARLPFILLHRSAEMTSVTSSPGASVCGSNHLIVQAIESPAVANRILARAQGAEDAVDSASGISGPDPKILDAHARSRLSKCLDHLNRLEYTGNEIIRVPADSRSLEHGVYVQLFISL